MADADARIDPEALLAHGDFVRGVARSLLWDEHAAEDVVQQTWLAALGAPGGRSRGWLAAVARNLAIKRLRGDMRRARREGAAVRREAVPSDAAVLARERLRRHVVDEVLALSEPYRTTVLLRYFEDLPPREVAGRMDVPVETVRTRTRRAIETLRVRLDARHGDERNALAGALLAWAGGPRDGATAAAHASAGMGGWVMGTKVVVAGAAVAAAAWLLWPRDETTSRETASASSGSSANTSAAAFGSSSLAPSPPRSRAVADERPAPPEPAPTKEPFVRGRVVDTEGRAAAGAVVVVSWGAAGPTATTVRATTDADGRFDAKAGAGVACRVAVEAQPAFAPRPAERSEVVPPVEDLVLVVERMPTATLVVTARDPEPGTDILDFTCDLGGKDLPGRPRASEAGRVEAVVRLAATAGDTVPVTVSAGGVSGRRDVALKPGDRVEVRVDLQRDGDVRGRVVDAAGKPVANALAFFGEEDVGRGDEPFKPFDEKRIRDGARTDGEGRFELRGKGRWVTIWHPDAGPVTVARASAGEIVLPARGVIRGVLRGADGAPQANAKVFLDRVREAATDGEGRFQFTGVEPGSRGLSLTGGKPKGYVVVRVAPGATVDVEVRPGLPSVRFEWPGRAAFGRFIGLVPLDAVGSLAIGEPADGAVVAKDVLPGRYLILGEGGALATVDVKDARATAVVGAGEIVVHAKPKTRLYVVPHGAGYVARLLAGRMAGAGVPADGVQRFTGLAPGRYEVGVERDGVRTAVDVRDGAPVDVTVE